MWCWFQIIFFLHLAPTFQYLYSALHIFSQTDQSHYNHIGLCFGVIVNCHFESADWFKCYNLDHCGAVLEVWMKDTRQTWQGHNERKCLNCTNPSSCIYCMTWMSIKWCAPRSDCVTSQNTVRLLLVANMQTLLLFVMQTQYVSEANKPRSVKMKIQFNKYLLLFLWLKLL